MTKTTSNESALAVQDNSNIAINMLETKPINPDIKEKIQMKTMDVLTKSSDLLDLIDSADDEISPELKMIRHTIAHEFTGLANLLFNLQDESCQKAVEILAKVKEREGTILFIGLGKTGHISKKIVATMSSTGSKAVFLHATECNHGDLGNITPKKDVIVMISNSGESDESFNTAEFCKEQGIPLIVMTSRPQSTLAKFATVVINLYSGGQEACHMGLAPTTSTTIALAMGDALANALSQKIGFTPDDFGASHPSGKLGMKRAEVRKNMEKPAPTIGVNATIKEASKALRAGGLGCVVITNSNNTTVGFLTDGDFSKAYENEINIHNCVAEVMTKFPEVVDQHEATDTAYQILKKSSIGGLIVVDDDNKPVGILDRKKLQQKLG